MATPAQIANDLEEHGKALKGRGQDMLCRSLMRGAATIRQLMDQVTVKETEATVQKLRADMSFQENSAIATHWIASALSIEYGEAATLLRESGGLQTKDPVGVAALIERIKNPYEFDE